MKIEEMRNERENINAKYMEYVQNKRSNPGAVHCFFEGKTDIYYYLPRIESKFTEENMNQIMPYTCKSKKNVVNLHNKIKQNNHKDILKTLFFVDRDFDLEFNKNILKSGNIYITPTHSMESFYVLKETFIRTVLRENGWINDENHLNNVSFLDKLYDIELQSYIGKIIKVCAWFKFQCEKATEDTYADLKLIKLDEEFKINGLNSTEVTLNELKEMTPNYFELDEEGLKSEMKNIIENPFELIQGKFIFPFISEILKKIKGKSKQLKVKDLKLKYKGKFKLRIYLGGEDSNLLSHLSQYALTPKCLNHYVNKKHKLIMASL